MFIPIVRRTVTVRAKDVCHFPFHCDVCRLSTWAHVLGEGVGSASMGYLAPDANAARQRATVSAHGNAQSLFAQSPCPRCGAHGVAQRTAVAAYDLKVASRKPLRFWALMVGFGLTFSSSAGCVAVCAADGEDGSLGAGLILGIMWFFFGAAATGFSTLSSAQGSGPCCSRTFPTVCSSIRQARRTLGLDVVGCGRSTSIVQSVPPPMTPLAVAGAVIAGRYRLESIVGKGGMGAVWATTHLGLHRVVAVKIISSDTGSKLDIELTR